MIKYYTDGNRIDFMGIWSRKDGLFESAEGHPNIVEVKREFLIEDLEEADNDMMFPVGHITFTN